MIENTVICKVCQQETADPVDYNGYSICQDCDAKICEYADKVESRKDRLYAAAERIAKDGQAIQSRARTMSDAIPFGQPILVGHHSEKRDRNYRERIRSTYQRGFERLQLAADLERKADAAAKNRAISSDDPAALIKIEEKLSKLEAQQEAFKNVNKIIQNLAKKPRTSKAEKEDYERRRREAYSKPGVEAMNAFHREEDAKEKAARPDYASFAPALAEQAKIGSSTAVKLLTPDYMGRVGIPGYELNSISAEIRRLKARIEELKARQIKAAQTPEETIEIGMITITLDHDDNRVKIEFPGKPIDKVIELCKAHGFHWSKHEGVWQRMINNSAAYWAKHIASETIKLMPHWAPVIVNDAPVCDPDNDYLWQEDSDYPAFDTQVYEPVYMPESLRIERDDQGLANIIKVCRRCTLYSYNERNTRRGSTMAPKTYGTSTDELTALANAETPASLRDSDKLKIRSLIGMFNKRKWLEAPELVSPDGSEVISLTRFDLEDEGGREYGVEPQSAHRYANYHSGWGIRFRITELGRRVLQATPVPAAYSSHGLLEVTIEAE
jgi:hypothetical protein